MLNNGMLFKMETKYFKFKFELICASNMTKHYDNLYQIKAESLIYPKS